MFYIYLAVVLAVTSSATSLDPTWKSFKNLLIGENIDIQNYYQVSIQSRNEHFCGGSLISKDFVLTAASCLYRKRNLTVRVGSSFLDRGGEIRKVDRYYLHKNFSRLQVDFRYNIALIRLKSPITNLIPIKLFKADEEVQTGTLAKVSGWGKTSENSSYYPTRLNTLKIPIINKKDCDLVYEYRGGISSGQLCAGSLVEGGKDACQGDGGGPLVVNDRQIGIVSWGIGCGNPRYPGVYTDVAYYRNWIHKITGV